MRQIENVLDLHLLRGDLPWSLAGTSGDRYRLNRDRRNALIDRINDALPEATWARLETVTTAAGREKIELVILDEYKGTKEVWQW